MKRTDEQKEAFAKECREIEKAGGDVLEHIRIHYPSYTPRATWYGLQMQFLNRRPGHLTEGKPNAIKERKRVKKHDTNDLLDRILQVIEDHGDPKQLLRDEGYTAPDQKWCSLRRWTLLHRPDDYEKLPADLKQYYANHGIQNAHRTPPPPPEPPKASGTWGEPDEAAETVIINGKEYEKLEGKKLYPPLPGAADKDIHGNHPVTAYIEKPSPTCCQPARPSKVTVPDELTEEKPVVPMKLPEATGDHVIFDVPQKTVEFNDKGHKMMVADEIHAWKTPLKVCAVKSRVKGEWHLSQVEGCVHLIWEDRMTHEERSLGLPAADWMKLAGEIPQMLMQLGLAN